MSIVSAASAIGGLVQKIQGVADSGASEKTSGETQGTDDFATLLNSILVPDGEKNVSEEALFAALTVQRVSALKGKDAGKEFQDLLAQTEQSMTLGSGYIPYEVAARAALKKYRDAGSLTKEEADQVNTEAFDAAQLDTNVNCLYDHMSGPNDPTKAVALITDAVLKAQEELGKIADGSVKATSRSLDAGFDAQGGSIRNPYDLGASIGALGSGPVPTGTITPEGNKVDGDQGFLFKPISDNSGKLCVLVPVSLEADALEVLLKDASGNTVESGTYWDGHVKEPGDPDVMTRKKFDFKKAGATYPDDLTVEVRYSNGTVTNYKIPDPAKRYD